MEVLMTSHGKILMINSNNVYAVINYKGGTGKTCTLVNLAYSLSKKNKRVLIIDTDPQGSVSYHLKLKPSKTLFDVIVKKTDPRDCITNARKNLDVIASNERLYPVDLYMHQQPNKEFIFRSSLSKISQEYDYVFLDCAPSMTLINQNVLLFSKQLLVPVSMEYMTLLGVKQLINNVKLLNKSFNETIRIIKIIPTFFNSHNKKTQNVYNSVSRVFSNYIAHPIRTNISISEASGQGQTVYEYNTNNCQSIEDFNKLTEEVLCL